MKTECTGIFRQTYIMEFYISTGADHATESDNLQVDIPLKKITKYIAVSDKSLKTIKIVN